MSKWLLRTWGVKAVALAEPEEVLRLRQLVDSLAERVAGQSELLTRQAEKTHQPTPAERSTIEAARPSSQQQDRQETTR